MTAPRTAADALAEIKERVAAGEQVDAGRLVAAIEAALAIEPSPPFASREGTMSGAVNDGWDLALVVVRDAIECALDGTP